nr:G protein-coupled receptor [Proales similis]
MNSSQEAEALDSVTLAYLLFWLYISPVISLLGVIANFLCLLGFWKLRLEHEIFMFMKLISLVDLFYLIFMALSFLPRCQPWCRFSDDYLVQLYLLTIDYYLTSCMAIFNILIDLTISVQRFLIVSNVKVFEKLRFWRIVIPIGLVSLVYYTPELFTKRIVQVQLSDTERGANSTRIGFALEPNAFGETQASRLILSMLGIIRGPVSLVILLIVNAGTIIQFRSLLERKKRLRGGGGASHSGQSTVTTNQTTESALTESRARTKPSDSNTNSLTLMTVCMSIGYIILSTPYTIFYILSQFLSTQVVGMVIFEIISTTLLFVYHGFHFFYYYVFNRRFREFYNLLKCM